MKKLSMGFVVLGMILFSSTAVKAQSLPEQCLHKRMALLDTIRKNQTGMQANWLHDPSMDDIEALIASPDCDKLHRELVSQLEAIDSSLPKSKTAIFVQAEYERLPTALQEEYVAEEEYFLYSDFTAYNPANTNIMEAMFAQYPTMADYVKAMNVSDPTMFSYGAAVVQEAYAKLEKDIASSSREKRSRK